MTELSESATIRPEARVPTSLSVVSQYCSRWRGNLSLSLECIVEAHEAIQNVPIGGANDSREISLVLSRSNSNFCAETDKEIQDVRVIFVYWIPPLRKLIGKPVPVDNETGLVPHVPNFLKTEERFDVPGAEIIHPACGVHMRKAKDDRESISKSILRLKAIYEVAFTPITGFEEWSGLPCQICALRSKLQQPAVEESIGVRRCSLCLMDFHDQCCNSLKEALPSDVSKRSKLLKIAKKKFTTNLVPNAILMTSERSRAY